MIMLNRRILLAAVFYLLLFSPFISAQFSYQVNAELGFYNSKSKFLYEENDLLARLEGKIAYIYEKDNTAASFQLKVRPEFYGFKKQLASFKFRGSGEYSRREDNFDWSINLSRQLNRIINDRTIINYDVFFLQGNVTLFSIPDLPISTNVGYAYQNVSSNAEQNLDLIFGEAKVNQVFSSYFRTGYGLYAEKFAIENKYSSGYQNINGSNSGYRVGPEVELYYLKDFIINCQYRFLFHASDATKFPSYEQWIKLVAGKILFPGVSAFILVNLYIRKFNAAETTNNRLSILYTPINQENYISFKTAYDLTDSINLYLKGGYFRENLIYNDYTFEGWNLVLAIELSN